MSVWIVLLNGHPCGAFFTEERAMADAARIPGAIVVPQYTNDYPGE